MALALKRAMAFRARSIRVGLCSSAGLRQIGSSSSSDSPRLSSALRASVLVTLSVSSESPRLSSALSASVLGTLSVSSESGLSTWQCPHW